MHVWTDGSCLGNPGPGGWAWYAPALPLSDCGGKPRTTNNEMEMTAILRALDLGYKYGDELTVHSDSQWAVNVLQGVWQARLYRGMLEEVRAAENKFKAVRYLWVPAHVGVRENETVDSLARGEALRQRRML